MNESIIGNSKSENKVETWAKETWDKGHAAGENVGEKLIKPLVPMVELMEEKQKIRKEIAERVQKLRKDIKLSQTEMAEAIGTRTLTYRGYENRKNEIPMVFLMRIAKLCDVSLDYIVGMNDNSSTSDKRLNDLESKLSGLLEDK